MKKLLSALVLVLLFVQASPVLAKNNCMPPPMDESDGFCPEMLPDEEPPIEENDDGWLDDYEYTPDPLMEQLECLENEIEEVESWYDWLEELLWAFCELV